ncbi:MAG TPA: ABC transporter ATP-binding protein [Nevskiaceae bacterium]|nr:ABC transporter ATP-binding protein [Nevskiaceae bacterium]
MSLLEVQDLVKTFGGFSPVDGVSFKVEEGSIHAVIGPNGAGKTTMFNLITGHVRPTAGRVHLAGRDITSQHPYKVVRLGLTRAFQLTNIFPHLTVLESVECAVNAHRHRSASPLFWQRRAARDETLELIEAVGLTNVTHTVSSTLSHGDQRTLEVALALATQPRLLLLDEPTAGMSPWETKRMVELVQTLVRSRGVTVLFCEHDMETVFAISDRITVLHRGKVIADGSPELIRSDAQVASVYLGSETA